MKTDIFFAYDDLPSRYSENGRRIGNPTSRLPRDYIGLRYLPQSNASATDGQRQWPALNVFVMPCHSHFLIGYSSMNHSWELEYRNVVKDVKFN